MQNVLILTFKAETDLYIFCGCVTVFLANIGGAWALDTQYKVRILLTV